MPPTGSPPNIHSAKAESQAVRQLLCAPWPLVICQSLLLQSFPLCFLSCCKSGERGWKLTDRWRTGQGFSLGELKPHIWLWHSFTASMGVFQSALVRWFGVSCSVYHVYVERDKTWWFISSKSCSIPVAWSGFSKLYIGRMLETYYKKPGRGPASLNLF